MQYTYLSPNQLPTLNVYLLSFLSGLELSQLDHFSFQNLLIELAFQVPKKIVELGALRDYILAIVRSGDSYWIHQAVKKDEIENNGD